MAEPISINNISHELIDSKGNKKNVPAYEYTNHNADFTKKYNGYMVHMKNDNTGEEAYIPVANAKRAEQGGFRVWKIQTGVSSPKAKQTQQAAEVGQTMFGGGEETTALQQAQQQVQQIQQANKEQQQGQTREHLDNPQMQSLFGYKNISNSRVVNDDSLWDEKGFKRPSGQPSIEEGERKAKENIGNVYESLVNGKGTRIDEKGRLRSNDPLAALQQERSERNAKVADATREEVKNTVGSVMADADKRFFDTYKSLIDNNHLDEQAAISVANQEISPEKVLEEVRSKVSENATKMILSNMATYEKAAKEEGVTTEEYISKYVMPEISAQVEQEFDKAEMARYMPENAGEYIFEGVLDSVTGMIANLGVTTPEQRQYIQRAAEEAGEKYGTTARIARVGTSFATDPYIFKGTGAVANGILGKAGLGSLEKTIGKTMAGRYLNFANANLSRVEKFAARSATSIAHGMINMGAYEGINGVVRTLYNGDTSLAGLGIGMFQGIRHGIVTGGAMGSIGSFFGELGSKLGARPGLSRGENFIRATDKAAFQMLGLVGEGFSMHLGEQINSQIEGTGFNLTWEGTLDNAIMAGVMKISTPSHLKNFKKNVASMFLAEPKDNPIRLSDDDKRELMKVTGSSSMEEVMTKIFPDGEKAEGNATNAQITEAQTRYLEMMNSLSWDAQNKISVALTGTACSARPRTGRFEADGNILYEYANDGTLLSTHEFKNTEEKNAYVYQKRLHQENVDFWGTYGKALLRDKDAVITAMTDIARQNGVQDEYVIKAMEKEPIRRTQGEREILRQIEEALHEMAFPKGEVHTEQSAIDGEKAAQQAEVTSDEPKTEVVNNTNVEVTQAMADFAEAMKDAIWKEDYEELKKQGMSDADIYNTLMEQYNEAELAPLADYVNAQAKQQGFMQGVANEIEQKKSEQTNLVTSGKVTINGVERTDGRVITLVDADGNIVRLLSGDFKLNEDGTIETEQPIIVSDDNGNPRPLNSVDGWKVAGSTDAGEYANYIRELLGQKATAVIDPNGEFAQPAPTEAPKETPKAETEVQRNESEGTTEAEHYAGQVVMSEPKVDLQNGLTTYHLDSYVETKSGKIKKTTLGGMKISAEDILASEKNEWIENLSEGDLDMLFISDIHVSKDGRVFGHLYIGSEKFGNVELNPNGPSKVGEVVRTGKVPDNPTRRRAPKAEPQQPVAEESKPTEPKKNKNGIPIGEDGEPNHVADGVKPVDAVNDIYNGGVLSKEEADGYVDEKIEEAQKAYDKVSKPISRNKGEGLNAYAERKAQHEAEVEQARQTLERWKAIYDEAHKFDVTKEDMENPMDFEGLDTSGMENTPEYLVASNMPKITPESFNEQVGLGAAEKRKNVGMIAKKENGGVDIDTAVLQMRELYPNVFGDADGEDRAKNIIIDILSSGGSRSYIKSLREKMLQEEAKAQAYEKAKADKEYLDNYGMEYDEYKMYEQSVYERIADLYRGVDEKELDKARAEQYLREDEEMAAYEADAKEVEQELTKTKENGRKDTGTEGRDGVLSEAQSGNEGGHGETAESSRVEGVRDKVQDKDGSVSGAAPRSEAVENLSLEETKAEIGRLQDERDMTKDEAKKAEIQKQIEELQKHGEEIVNKEAADYLAESGIKEGDVLVPKNGGDKITVKEIDGHNVVIEQLKPNGRETKTIHGIYIKNNYDKAEKGDGFFGGGAKAEPEKPAAPETHKDRLHNDKLPFEERIKDTEPLKVEDIDGLSEDFNGFMKDQVKSAIEKLESGQPLTELEKLFYLNALKDVRDTDKRSAQDSTDADRAQLAQGDNASEHGGNGSEGVEATGLDREGGRETPEGQPSGENSEDDLHQSSGSGGDREVRGGEPADDGISGASMESEPSGNSGSDGRNVRQRKGEGISGTTPSKATRDDIKSGIEAKKKKLAEIAKRLKKTPKNTPPRLYDVMSALGAWIGKMGDSVDWKAVGEFAQTTLEIGADYFKLGVHDFKEWARRIKGDLAETLKDTFGWGDAEVDDFIREMWNSKYTIDGKTYTIGQWASIIGDEALRKEIHRSLDEKREQQKAAESIEVKVGDRDNIDDTLPYLLPKQRNDVYKAEMQFFDKKHQDREHGFGKGMMFTNGTGTGKTYTGLGIVKRFVKQGKGRVLIVTPSQPKVADWVKDGQNLGLEVTPLENTKDAGNGVVCTTYANLRANEAVLRDTFDLIVYDESHKIMENKKGEETIGTAVHYQLSNKNKQHAVERVKMKYEPFRKEKELRQEADDTRNIQENAINKLRELDISLPKHPTNSAEIDEHIRAIEQEGENVEGNKEKLNYLRIAKNAFNRLGEIPREIEALKPEQEKLMPEIEKEAEEAVKRTKSVFLSATPFNTRESLKYAEGYLFSYPEEDKNTVGTYNHRSPEQAFLEQHFSAGYRWRYGRLEQHMENAEALAKQEVRFSDYLQDQLGTLSTRQINNGYDYSRTFPTVTLDKAETFNQALQDVFHDKTMQPLWEAFHDVFYDYNKQTALFETMKTALAAERIREHLARGRKVVVFHRRRTTKDELQNPFQQALTIAKVNSENMSAQDKQKVADAIAAFHGKYGDLLKWEQGLDYRLPREQLADIFGEDKVAFFSGEETTKQKNQSIADFMKDNKGKDIIVIQEASGKEGISLHDQTGEHQRVQISLCLPQSPIAFIQSEGRIYRIGQKSNAVFEYPLLGLNLEINLWAHKFNNALGTTEYLAMGSKARNLSESIAKGIMENSGTIGYDDAGVGGKAYDGNVEAQTATGFDGAITDYFTNQKISAKRENREGVDYFPTPEPVGYKMVEWAGLTEGESALEPSAGHGAIARYVPKSNNLTMIEPSQSLMSKLVLNTPGSGRKYEGGTFEDYNVINKHDAIVMNPPYGAGGTTAVEHVAKGFKHLNEGGRLIAIIPDGPACDKKMQKWLESKDAESAVITGEIKLPSCTFGRAGTAVNTRIVVIDKVTREEVRNGMPTRKEVDLRSVTDVNELFEKMRDIDMPERTIDKEYLREKAAKNFRRKIADPDSANKFVVSFVEANQKFVRIDFKRGGTSLWIDVEEIQNDKDAALRNYRRLKDRYDTADASFRANRTFTMGRGSNKVEIREADIKRDIYQNAMEFVAKVAGTTVKELDARNNELMERLRNGSKPTEQPQTEAKPQDARWEYSVVKHTQTGADLHIVKSKERMTDEEYRKELAKAKSLGGFYDRYSKGFRFETKENADKFMQSKESSSVKTDVRETMKDYMPEKEISEIEERTNKEVEENLAQIPDERKEEVRGFEHLLQEGLPMESFNTSDNDKNVGLKELEEIYSYKVSKYEEIRALYENMRKQGYDKVPGNESLGREVLSRTLEESYHEDRARLALIRREIAFQTAKREKLGREFGISENNWIKVDDAERMFRAFNSDKSLGETFDAIIGRIRDLNVAFATADTFKAGTNAVYSIKYGTILLRGGRLFGSHTDKQGTASDILHEMIHPLTSDPIRLYELGGEYRKILTPEQQRVAKEVIDLFNKLKKNEKDFLDDNGKLMYGLSKPTEFLNEAMSDLAFRDRLKGKGVWGKIKEWVKSLFGISDMQKAEKLFNDILRTYDLRDENNRALHGLIAKHAEEIYGNEPQAKKIDASNKDLTEDDKKAIADLNSGDKEKTKTVYRAMQVIDGMLYPPMAARIEGELVEGAKSGDILKADEHPELIKMIDGKPKFVLDKGGNDATGKKASSVPARYNPYWHTSNSPMNDQFKSAWIRPNMVTVECEIPVSELTSGYKAEFAKDAVGMVPWKSGSVTGELVKQGHPGREVYLSRYCKIGRVLSDAETAEKIKEFIGDKDVSVPENVVTPKVRQELEKLGVKIGAPEKGVKKSEQIKEAIANGLEVDNTTRFSEGLQSEVSKPEDKPTVRAHIDTVSKDLNTPCEVHNDASIIKNEKVRKAIESGRKVKGWWDKDGVHLYMPNIHSRHDAETTILHETVGHDGLRKLMNGKDGKSRNFQKFLDMVWADKKNTALHEFVKEYAPKNGWDLHEAVDEWLAREAEKPVTDENFGMWGRVKAMFNNVLRALGFKSDMSLNDVRYAIWLSKRMKQKPNDPLMKARAAAFRWGMEHSNYKPEVKDGRYVDSEDGKDETRLAAPLTPSGAGLREKLERDLEQNDFAWSEAHLDDMRSLRGFMDIVADGKKIRDADNAYLMENHCGSIIMTKEQEWLGRKYAPINDAALEIMGRIGKSGKAGEDAIEEYMIKRSALERNRVFFVRDAVNEASKSDKDVADRLADDWKQAKEKADGKLISDPSYTLRDWCAELDDFIRKNIDKNYDPNKNDKSGVNWFDPNRNKDTFEFNEQTIIDDILDFESACGDEKIGKFWDAVKDATDSTVDIAWECGDITGETRDHLKDMMNHYVPLRGYQEETAEDIFSYVTNGRGESYKPIRKASGRKSLAEHPLAHIRMLGYYSIARGEKNKVKQALYRFVTRNLDELKKQNTVSVSDIWEVKKTDPVTGKEEWEAVLPQYDAEWSDKKKADTVQQFYENMKTLKAKGDARIAKDSSHIGMTFREQMNKNQHIVEVNINGKKKLLYFNYNPRVAQAINGKTKAASVKHHPVLSALQTFKHKLAGLYTSYNPEFAVRNFVRDTIFAKVNILTKENWEYSKKFDHNQAVAFDNIWRLFPEYNKGLYDNATRGTLEWYFREFMRNGGKTGYAQNRKIEEAMRDVAKGLDATSASVLAKYLGKGWEGLRDIIEGLNDRAENINRFAAFVTSMQMGRGILRSVHDAKTVTVNFDRKGAGSAAIDLAKTGNEKAAAYTASIGRGAYLFYNATMQGLAIMGTNAKRNPVKFSSIMVATPLVAGMMQPLFYNYLTALFGNDDEDAYAKIPYWDRRNNICIPRDGKGGYFKIALPIDLRSFYGIGDLAASVTYMPTLKTENGFWEDFLSQLTQLSPVDILQGGPSSWLTNLTPSVLQPVEQVKSNKAWTGKPIYKEDKYNTGQKSVYRAYPSVNSLVVGAAKGVHEMSRDYKSIPAELDVTGLDMHPAEVDYLLHSYLGSIYTMTDKIWSTGEAGFKKLKGEETDYEIGKFPIFGTMFGTQNEKNIDKATNAKYYNYLDEFKHAEYMLSGLKKVKGSIENIEFKNSDLGKRYYFYKDNYKDKINGLRKKIKNEKDDTERKKYERDLQEAQTEMVQALDRMN